MASDGNSVASIFGPIALGWIISLGVGWNKPNIGVAIAALMGFGIAMYLGMQHGSDTPSACNIDSSFNCDDVNRSPIFKDPGISHCIFGCRILFFNAFISVLSHW